MGDKIRNELQKNEITLIHAKEENRKIQSASQFEKAEMRRNSEDITNRLKNELAASKQNEEESKIDLQRAIQNLKEQKAKIEELIENTEELKTDCSNSKHRVKQLIESTR